MFFRLRLQTGDLPLHAPRHLSKVASASDVAVRVIVSPTAYCSVQSPGHDIPPLMVLVILYKLIAETAGKDIIIIKTKRYVAGM